MTRLVFFYFHILGEMEISTNEKNESFYICAKCNFKCIYKSDWERHILTAKHNMETMDINRKPSKPSKPSKNILPLTCECGKIYKNNSGLWKHKHKCTFGKNASNNVSTSESVDSSLVIELLKQNQEFKEMMIEQHKQIQEQNKQMIELAKTSGNTTNNTNNTNNTINNNKFNLNVFLNETCKDAINLNDFIQSIELTIRDFVNTGEVGYVRGISNIMLERIRDMEPHVRPIHCTDLKRETVYVKDSDKWAKEDDNKTHIRKAVRIVANKNKDQVHSWIQENPNYEVLDTPECDKFFEYSKASLGGYGKEENSRFENKIISNVLKEVVVNKDKMLE